MTAGPRPARWGAARIWLRPWGAVASGRLWLAAAPIIAFTVIALVGPLVVEYDHIDTNLLERLLPPLAEVRDGVAWFGTDQVGRDIFGQVLYGARISLTVGFATVLIAGVAGSLIGVVSGFTGGWLDNLVMRLADIQLSLPAFLLAIIIAAVIGPSVANVILTLALTRWVVFARVARGSTLAVREREFVDSARVLGASNRRLVLVHILPIAITPLLIVATTQFGLVILAEASLSFLGLGTPPTVPSWGQTIASGRDYLATAWWISTLPGVVLAVVTISFGVFGDALRDRLDPQMQSR